MDDYACNSCGARWSTDDVQKARWMGTMFRCNEQTGALICPECYDAMRASLISRPGAFSSWVKETLASA